MKSLQAQIDANNAQQAALRAEIPTDDARKMAIANSLAQLSGDLASLLSKMAAENSNYTSQLASIDQQLSWAKLASGQALERRMDVN